MPHRIGPGRVAFAAVAAAFIMSGDAFSQTRNPADNSLDMSASVGGRRAPAADVLRNQLPENCFTGIATDRTVACNAPSRVTAPTPAVPTMPCTPASALRNPALGPLPGTCP